MARLFEMFGVSGLTIAGAAAMLYFYVIPGINAGFADIFSKIF